MLEHKSWEKSFLLGKKKNHLGFAIHKCDLKNGFS